MDLTEEEINQLRQLEESLWLPEVRLSRDKMDALLDEGFIEFGSSGRKYDKRDTLDAAIQPFTAQLPLPDYSVRLLAPSIALATYKSVVTTADGSKRIALRSSTWTKSEESWKILFHQGTPLGSPNS